jgi:hypothetical protein
MSVRELVAENAGKVAVGCGNALLLKYLLSSGWKIVTPEFVSTLLFPFPTIHLSPWIIAAGTGLLIGLAIYGGICYFLWREEKKAPLFDSKIMKKVVEGEIEEARSGSNEELEKKIQGVLECIKLLQELKMKLLEKQSGRNGATAGLKQSH